MAAMAGILITNVACRYGFGFSLTWSAEAARYCMVWVAFLGIAVLVYRGEHLSVNLFGPRLGPRGQKALRGVILFGSVIFFAIQSVFGGILVVRTYGQTAASIPWLPMNVVYAVIPLSGVIMTLSSTCEMVKLIRHDGGDT
ncbi:MAG: hypothetical protein A2Z25_22350 [Planctomycetes bacterium RBG_16_55_9]|nr:MAG: hypothetical protein A2Z25_22350 [Planctomycetes bacterium RBG_16_55_9]